MADGSVFAGIQVQVQVQVQDSDLACGTRNVPHKPMHGTLAWARQSTTTYAVSQAIPTVMQMMTESKKPSIYNVPNALTSIRFGLAIAVMVLIPAEYYPAALIIFVIAASTDWMDGYWARKYGQVTKLGRIFDPFVDKIIICGTFISLVAVPDSGVASWMATIVIGRELLVTSLRGMIEGSGGDFSASQLGKWKMVLQCVAVVAILVCMIQPDVEWIEWTSFGLLWAAIVLTVYSGIDYSFAAARVMREPALSSDSQGE